MVGGIYGIGGGSLPGPILVGRGLPVAPAALAALASTFATSVVGAATFALLSLVSSGDVAPDWSLGTACGAGGPIGGYLGARLQPHLPETALRLLLGALATALGALYLAQALRRPSASAQRRHRAARGRGVAQPDGRRHTVPRLSYSSTVSTRWASSAPT
ncbi:Sulfite exporter TauE/SafE [Streptomyces sp. S4.7]|nr:Sulfite exporter TauE/SafE [Streptomyces sp. S4.7]